jgi:Domain of unknown function (DUF6259)
MSFAGVRNESLSLRFDLTHGIALQNILDVAINREYLRKAPSALFEYAVNNETPPLESTQLSVISVEPPGDGSSEDGPSLSVVASDGQLTFSLQVSLPVGEPAAILRLSITTNSESPLFVRVVMPKIRGLITKDNASQMMGTIPQEVGSVIPMTSDVILGMPFGSSQLALSVGLPTSYNNMELASLYDPLQGGGVFFCDVDGDVVNGPPPLQFNLSAAEVVAFWIGNVSRSSPAQLSGLAIGVHPTSDWHTAVDFYTTLHRFRWTFPTTPAWFRDAPAIYAPTPITAGSIYLVQDWQFLADGTVWNTWEDNDGPWKDGCCLPDFLNGTPAQISKAAFGPPGALLQVAMQNSTQLDLFAVGANGAIWVTWEAGNGVWQNGRDNTAPAMITPPGYAVPGSSLACGQQGDDQLDVFFVRNGNIWVTWERGDTAWADGLPGHQTPVPITESNLVPPEASLIAAKLSDTQLNVFFIDIFGAIRTVQVEGYGAWQELPISGPDQFTPGASLAVIAQGDGQASLFAISNLGTICVFNKAKDTGWPLPTPASPQGFAPLTACLAAAIQNPNQLDVFVVRADGAVWVSWGIGNSWTDGILGGNPQPITTPNLTASGAPIATAKQGDNQLDVFVAGAFNAIWVTSQAGDSAWTDGANGRPGPANVTPFGYVPIGGGVAAFPRSKTHVDAFAVGFGRIQSFLQLPRLLCEAQSLGTNIVYLTDYWEGADEGNDPPWWNKGDYLPRSDLGGIPAFIEGIQGIHDAGGKVILYLEPFIIYQFSTFATKYGGSAWAGLDDNGQPLADYARNYSMVAPLPEWQQHVAQIATGLVQQYGADGIFLDSYAWQMNRPMRCNVRNSSYSALDYSRGALTLTQTVRNAIQAVNSEAIVLGETTAGPIAHYWDGGLAADFGFANPYGPGSLIESLPASPVRYGIPEVHIFTNGRDLNGLHQMYAAGHGLALSSLWFDTFMFLNKDHIRCLVEIRRTYKDALIHGAQTYQPRSDHPCVVAYNYQGTTHRIVTIVNISTCNQTANITLATPDNGFIWTDLITKDEFEAKSQVLENISLPYGTGSLRVLLHSRPRGFIDKRI